MQIIGGYHQIFQIDRVLNIVCQKGVKDLMVDGLLIFLPQQHSKETIYIT